MNDVKFLEIETERKEKFFLNVQHIIFFDYCEEVLVVGKNNYQTRFCLSPASKEKVMKFIYQNKIEV